MAHSTIARWWNHLNNANWALKVDYKISKVFVYKHEINYTILCMMLDDTFKSDRWRRCAYDEKLFNDNDVKIY